MDRARTTDSFAAEDFLGWWWLAPLAAIMAVTIVGAVTLLRPQQPSGPRFEAEAWVIGASEADARYYHSLLWAVDSEVQAQRQGGAIRLTLTGSLDQRGRLGQALQDWQGLMQQAQAQNPDLKPALLVKPPESTELPPADTSVGWAERFGPPVVWAVLLSLGAIVGLEALSRRYPVLKGLKLPPG